MSYFVFALTNPEAEPLLKREISHYGPDFKLSYSKPGFYTFKAPMEMPFRPKMARLVGVCHGRKNLAELKYLERAWVWARNPEDKVPHELFELSKKTIFKVGETATLIMMVEENEFWVGEYQLQKHHFQTPGEVSSIESKEVISRAYYKIAEAFESFDLPFEIQEKVLELGSAPGGASQFLIEQDMLVYGVDTAEMDSKITKSINFKHVRKPFEMLKAEDIPFDIDWILCDINLPPTVIVKEVERLLGFLEPRGLVLTLKLNQDRYVTMMRTLAKQFLPLGFKKVDLKYLPSHRQEIALIAIRD